ncbi:unnamed protein product [Mytilus edulis]|uniref:Peptidase A2 domain-containing protein n=1 Tax=Mytilus edulis TaxID=6550 RepID=A0A8S3Q4E4_MYTED|nr:unnamed protein product [Mytilus edulis]
MEMAQKRQCLQKLHEMTIENGWDRDDDVKMAIFNNNRLQYHTYHHRPVIAEQLGCIPEPSNRYDVNAVLVSIDSEDRVDQCSLPRSRSCEIFHDLTPTGEISIRVNQDQWPSQENTDRYEKDGIHHTDKRPLSGGLSPSTKVAIDQAKNKEVTNRATVVHLEPNATWPVKQNLGEESSTLYNHAARPRYGFWSQKAEGSTIAAGTVIAEGYAEAEGTAEAKGSAEGDSGNTRRVMTSCESRRDSGDLPRTLDRDVLHNMGATYQALPLTSRGRFRVGVNGTDHEHQTSTFDGEGNWEDYLVQFELIAAINKWSDLEKALELATSLRGTAQSILTDLRPEMRTNFVRLTAALASRFQPENQAEMYRAQMKSRIRGRTEQIPVLGQDIKRLVRLAYPSAPMEVREYLARDCFIDSLNDADMEWAIFQAKAENIDNAVHVALEYEAFQNGRRKHSTKPVRAVDEYDNFDLKREIYLSEQVDDISGRLAKMGESGRPNDWSGKLSVAETEDQVLAETNYDLGESKNFDKLSQIKSTNSDSLYVIVNVFDMKLNCLIDTGSTVSVLNSSMYNTMSQSAKPKLSNQCSGLRMANGSVVMPMGTAVFPVQLNKKIVYHRLIVADIDIPMIIGFDFLNKNNCILDMGKRTIEIDGQFITCQREHCLNSIFKISSVEDVEIPPTSEMIVQGTILQGIPHKVTGLIEPAGSFLTNNGCLIAKAVVNPSRQYLPVRIINLSEKPVRLYREAIIGQCELIDSDTIEINVLSKQTNAMDTLYHISNQENVLPEYLQNLYERSISHLEKEQQDQVYRLLFKYQTAFSKCKSDLGRTNIVKHKINTGDAPPFKMQPRRLPIAKTGNCIQRNKAFT